MTTIRTILAAGAVLALAAVRALAQDPPAPAPYSCTLCHGEADLWEGEEKRFHVTEGQLAEDVHWLKGLRCHDCHGGDPSQEDYAGAHGQASGFRKIASPADVPDFCGRCHSDVELMRRYNPSPRTDQAAEFWTSGHGKRLKETADPKVATCVSCHGHHGILKVADLASPVYPTNVAGTCAKCHADAERMAGYTYHGRPLGTEQHEKWLSSVHGKAMVEKGDLSAPTCNDCHGNHGALPPEIGSVVNACGSCHGKVAELFNQTRMKHRFEEVGLPGCATCHNAHDIMHPTDEMVGMGPESACARCHAEGRFGATTAGAEGSRRMREGLEHLKREIAEAESRVESAEKLGMEVRGPKFELIGAHGALTNARTLIHGMALDPVLAAIGKGLAVTGTVKEQADAAHSEHAGRRRWLASSLVLIALAVGVLLVLIRRLPAP